MVHHEQNRFWFSSIIGFFYQFGVGCYVDDDKALEFYLLAVNNDEKEFLNHKFIQYLKSAQKGDSEAQCNLGECYYYGRDVSQDYVKAFKWYLKSANNGFP